MLFIYFRGTRAKTLLADLSSEQSCKCAVMCFKDERDAQTLYSYRCTTFKAIRFPTDKLVFFPLSYEPAGSTHGPCENSLLLFQKPKPN